MRFLYLLPIVLLGTCLMIDKGHCDEPDFADLPFGVTSLGGAVDGEWLYIYGGNRAAAHHYHREGQNNKLMRINLREGGEWQEVATGPHMQGLGMVAYEGKIFRIGGLMALNEEDEEQKLQSTDEVAYYDVNEKKWVEAPSLPEPRSSFDAVVSDGVIYVIGGWTLGGEEEEGWLDSACRLDLKHEPLKWETIAEAPFERRANSLAELDGKIYTIGGMMSSGGPTTEVSIYDPEKDEWSNGPEIPGEAMDGFGSASFKVGERLIVSTSTGKMLRLSKDGEQWEELEPLSVGRFFHRMLPLDDGQVIIVGGTNMQSGKKTAVLVSKVN